MQWSGITPGNVTAKTKFVGVFALCSVVTMAVGTSAGPSAQADARATGIYVGVNQQRQACGAVSEDARLTAAAQRHADDMLRNSAFSHTGSDGSSPRARMSDAGYGSAGSTGEIVFWATGSAATAESAIAFWMQSPGHRAIILNCGFTAGGFATASDGNMMTAVGDFAGP
ncbi:Allergen V5/Tpx-1 family protein [Mycolicibacterium aurum]|uniref:Allergen V5/Tpx-1 family protein n=1 Tax=Mycolicibacterium aurum TaxID=1791 RepID=A0A3S4VP46_MYCAU|nr:Allergen V5/Tpx-1 family protein [Mycolicibacterium aurum]